LDGGRDLRQGSEVCIAHVSTRALWQSSDHAGDLEVGVHLSSLIDRNSSCGGCLPGGKGKRQVRAGDEKDHTHGASGDGLPNSSIHNE
jgi:hypothetical protein